MSHTPGPWGFLEGDAERRSTSTVFKADDDGFLIAHVVCEARQQDQRAEDIANAKLISAAPELLAACIAMRKTMHSPDSEESRLANSAIAKATS